MATIFTGDTVRIKATFRDWAPEGQTGALVDPDASEASVTIYDGDLNVLTTGAAIRESLGVYYYDWTTPATEGNYFFEFKGMFSLKPQLTRQKFTIKFKPTA